MTSSAAAQTHDWTAEGLELVARRWGLDDPARLDAWAARVRVDAGPLGLLRGAPVPEDQPLVDLQGLARRPSPRQVGARSRRVSAGGVTGTARDVRSGQLRATDRVEDSLRTIEERAHLNAFLRVFDDESRADATAVDEQVDAGRDPGPLAGVTVAVKDLIDVEGYATTGGTRVLGGQPAEHDADCVARLRAAGAVVVGMANLHGLAYGALSTNGDFGRVLNPRREAALAGGSSGGSAAAVAGGLVDVALGTDTSGSIRIPAACCGVVGLKPTYGRLPLDGILPLARSMDTVGPLTKTVADAAALLEVLSPSPFTADDAAWEDLAGVTVGLPRTYFLDHLVPEVQRALDDACAAIRSAGGQVVDVDTPSFRHAPAAQLYTMSPEAFDVHRDLLAERGADLPEDIRLRLEMGMFFLSGDYVRAQRLRGLLQSEIESALATVDVLLTPTLAMTAPDAGTDEVLVGEAVWPTQFAMTRLTMPFNATGHPALTLPWGADDRGAPIGLQLAGRAMDEAGILGVGHVLEHKRADFVAD